MVLRDVAEPGRSVGLAVIPLRAEATRTEGEINVLYGRAHRSVQGAPLHESLVDSVGRHWSVPGSCAMPRTVRSGPQRAVSRPALRELLTWRRSSSLRCVIWRGHSGR